MQSVHKRRTALAPAVGPSQSLPKHKSALPSNHRESLLFKRSSKEIDVKVVVKDPPWNGGSPITGYVIEAKVTSLESQEQKITRSLSTASCTLSGIPAGATINVRAQAKNHVGASSFCASRIVEMPILVPGVVEDLGFKQNGSSALKCTWRRPAFKGGGAILGYEAQVEPALQDPNSGVMDESQSVKYLVPPVEFDADTLDSDLRYASKPFLHIKLQHSCNAVFCRVRAINKRGAGPFTDWRLMEVKRSAKKLEIEAPNLRVTSLLPLELQWSLSKQCSNVASEVLYLLEYKDLSEGNQFRQLYRGNGESYCYTKAQPGHSYVFRVRLVSKEVSSPFSMCAHVKIPGEVRTNRKDDSSTAPAAQRAKPRRKRNLKEASGSKQKSEKSKLVDAKEALRWRRMPWYRRYPFISIPLLLAACYALLEFCLFVYYA